MFCDRTPDGLIVRTPAKLNLFLEVLGKRPDGYHDLATLMVAVSLFDTLEFKEDASQDITLTLASPDNLRLSVGPDNLVWRAADLLRRRTNHCGGATIRLHKRIPLAAGLAGGSSDAAGTLVGLNRLWRLGLADAELAELGAELGSDVAFFLHGNAAWCTGRGEIVTPLRPGRELWFVLVCPPVGLSTAAVFKALEPPALPHDGTPLREAVERGDVNAIGQRLFNRLQPVAERLCPEVAELSRDLSQVGAAGCLMSGSGSTLFLLCRNNAEAHEAAEVLTRTAREKVSRVHVVRSCF